METLDVKNLAVFAVMGTTGSGKSTFIQKATGRQDVPIGHKYEACTQEPWLYEFFFEGRKLAILDTPGFDDTYKTDAEVLQGVATFLAATYKQGMKLRGIIYLHRITDPRMTHGGRANLELFRALCGDDPLHKVVLATTFWGEMSNNQRAEEHEIELRTKPEYWGDMISKKAAMTQFLNTKDSALDIIRELLRNEEKITLKIQREMVDQNLDLIQTSAGETLKRELCEITEKYEKEIVSIRKEMEAALKAHDIELHEVKEKQTQRSDHMRQALVNQMDILKYQTKEDLRAREMEFDARLMAMVNEQKIETDGTIRDNIPEGEGEEACGDKVDGGETLDDEMTMKTAMAKRAKREKALEIFGAVGTTLTAAGLAVINPLAIPVAFSGLIDIINTCFTRKEPADLKRNPDTYTALASE